MYVPEIIVGMLIGAVGTLAVIIVAALIVSRSDSQKGKENTRNAE